MPKPKSAYSQPTKFGKEDHPPANMWPAVATPPPLLIKKPIDKKPGSQRGRANYFS